jgi:hypothetical protein
MSRVVTPPQAQSPQGPMTAIPQEKIATRAYEKWLKRGQPQGTEMLDWLEAEKEIRSEMSRSKTPSKY